MKLGKRKKTFVVIAVFFLLFSVFLVLFHHHQDGQNKQDCAVCRLVQQIVFCFALGLAILITVPSRSQKFFETFRGFTSLLFTLKLHSRAPPLLS